MNNAGSAAAALMLAFALAACVSLEPALPEAKPQIPQNWPLPATTAAVHAYDIGWREFFVDAKLAELIARALDNNRDMRVTVLNVERARALYRVQRSAQVPWVDAGVAGTRSGGDRPPASSYSALIGIADFELDLFGRVRSLSESALQLYLAQEEARRAAQLSLIAEVASAYLTLAADRESLRVSEATIDNHESAYRLTLKRFELGAVSRLDLAQARAAVENARAIAARYAGQVAQDGNALTLLAGTPIDTELLPQGLDARAAGLAAVPAGLPSEVLLRRPDVLRAEHALRAANANIGAARAAFFPSVRLTGNVGSASEELSGLFSGSSYAWNFLPSIRLPIFQGGRLQAAEEVAQAERDIALAQYEKSIQTAFRETADALALTQALREQRVAQQAFLDAATQAHDLSKARYEAGRDSFLLLLDAQRTLYAAQLILVNTRLAEQVNRVTLYKVLGGGWKE